MRLISILLFLQLCTVFNDFIYWPDYWTRCCPFTKLLSRGTKFYFVTISKIRLIPLHWLCRWSFGHHQLPQPQSNDSFPETCILLPIWCCIFWMLSMHKMRDKSFHLQRLKQLWIFLTSNFGHWRLLLHCLIRNTFGRIFQIYLNCRSLWFCCFRMLKEEGCTRGFFLIRNDVPTW